MYNFILNMWIMGKIDEDYMMKVTKVGRITEEERDMILSTPQNA